jgi:hypothetical protein
MKCYKHPKVDAIGVCHECGEGICSKCAVKIAGKLYCKDDADKVFGAQKAQAAPAVSAAQAAPNKASQKSMRNSVLGQSSVAWFLAIIGLFMFPPICFGIGAILGYSAVSKATDNLDVFSKRDVAVCGIGAMANVLLFGWWAIGMVDILSMFY